MTKKKDTAAEIAATDAITTSVEEIREDLDIETPAEAEEEPYDCDCGICSFCNKGIVPPPVAFVQDLSEAPVESIPAQPEGVTAEFDGSNTFYHPLPVHLTAVELGAHSEEQARLFNLLLSTRELKRAANKKYGDDIKDIEKKLEEISTIVNEGTAERPVKCVWQFRYTTGEKILWRLDTDPPTEVDRKTLTIEERQQDLNFVAGSSIDNVRAAFGNGAESEPVSKLASACTENPCEMGATSTEGDFSAEVQGDVATEGDKTPQNANERVSAVCKLSPPEGDPLECMDCGNCQHEEFTPIDDDDDWPDPPQAA